MSASVETINVCRAVGQGIYSVPEASRYTQLHPQRIRAWLRRAESETAARFLNPEFPRGDTYLLSFLDLIDVLVAGQFRKHGVSMPVVRDAYAILAQELRTSHPFCHGRLCSDGRDIFLFAAREIDDPTLSSVMTGQHVFPRILDDYLRFVDYDETTELAERWRISRGVVIDPDIGFGKPVVESTGTTTYILANAFAANDEEAGLVADLFAVSPNDVMNAVAFERRIREPRAA